jgi:hypothetical protein
VTQQAVNNPRIIDQNGQVVSGGEEGEQQETEQVLDKGIYALVAQMRQDDLMPGVALHLQALEVLCDGTPETKEALASVYTNAQASVTLKEFLADHANEDVPILGMMFYEQMPFKARATGEWQPGYLQVRLLTALENAKGQFIVIKASGKGIAQHAFYILKNRGWFLFPDGPISYRFSVSASGAHSMYNVSHDAKRLLMPGKVKK